MDNTFIHKIKNTCNRFRLKIINENQQLGFVFYQNDEIFCREVMKPSYKGIVIEYHPEKNNPKERLLVQDENGDKIWTSPYYCIPLHHKTFDTRQRIYLTPNSQYQELHQLFNTIIHFPLYSINSQIQSKRIDMLFPFSLNQFFIQHIISLPESGFLYLATDKNNKNIAILNVYDKRGRIKHQSPYILDQKIYQELLSIKEIL